MSDIVRVENDELYIDSVELAEEFGVKYDNFWKLLMKHKDKIERHGVIVFGTRKPKTGRPMQIASLTEPQALTLLTYTRSSEKTDELRFKLISEFKLMKDFLNSKYVARAISIETRKELTDIIQDSGENERMHGRGYSNYTRLVYSLTGLTQRFKMYKNACKEKGVKPDKFRKECLNVEETKRVDLAESLIKPLLELEKEYGEIKTTLEPLFNKKEIDNKAI